MAQKIKLYKKNLYYTRLKQKLFNFIHVDHFFKFNNKLPIWYFTWTRFHTLSLSDKGREKELDNNRNYEDFMRFNGLKWDLLEILPVGDVSYGKYVWGNFMSLLSLVNLNDLLCVDRKPLVGVDHHAKQTGVGLTG